VVFADGVPKITSAKFNIDNVYLEIKPTGQDVLRELNTLDWFYLLSVS